MRQMRESERILSYWVFLSAQAKRRMPYGLKFVSLVPYFVGILTILKTKMNGWHAYTSHSEFKHGGYGNPKNSNALKENSNDKPRKSTENCTVAEFLVSSGISPGGYFFTDRLRPCLR